MALDDVNRQDVTQLMAHLRILVGVASLLDVVGDLGTVRWLLGLAEANSEMVTYHARVIQLDLERAAGGA
ncbi:hypothetical protein [Streptomyces noursei]